MKILFFFMDFIFSFFHPDKNRDKQIDIVDLLQSKKRCKMKFPSLIPKPLSPSLIPKPLLGNIKQINAVNLLQNKIFMLHKNDMNVTTGHNNDGVTTLHSCVT